MEEEVTASGLYGWVSLGEQPPCPDIAAQQLAQRVCVFPACEAPGLIEIPI